eukprot:10901467-Alexandrium_andersonii.AAC.1
MRARAASPAVPPSPPVVAAWSSPSPPTSSRCSRSRLAVRALMRASSAAILEVSSALDVWRAASCCAG